MSRSRLTGALVVATVLSMLPGYQRVGADQPDANAAPSATPPAQAPKPDASKFLTQPLVTEIYTADPSAHVFDGKIFIYPSHDIDAGVPPDDLGSHFAMRDYHVFSMDRVGGPVSDRGVALDIRNVPWAGRQMWAPDAAEKGGKYDLYFPVKDKQDVFRIGAAVGDKPWGPFAAQPEPIKGSYSIDPAIFKDTGGEYLHVLRRHLGRTAAALGLRHVQARGRLSREGSAGTQRESRTARQRHGEPRGGSEGRGPPG